MVRCSFAFTVCWLCLLWYTASSASSIVNKVLMDTFPYPLTVTLSSLGATALYSVPLLNMIKGQQVKRHITTAYLFKYIVPLSVGKVMALAFAFISIWKVPVSYSHTVKASMPLFAVFTARIVLHERQTCSVYFSLLPIFFGIAIASITELSFNLLGLLSALASTFTYSLLNAFVKKVLQDTGLHHLKILSLLAQCGFCIFLPVWCIHDAYSIWKQITNQKVPIYFHSYTLVMLALSGVLNFFQNLITFTLIHKLTALSYAVANAAKRVIVITVSLLTLRNPITFWNGFGMLLAVVGVFCYNRAKQFQNKHGKSILKHNFTHATLSDASLVTNYIENEKIFYDKERPIDSKDNSSRFYIGDTKIMLEV